MMTSRRQNLETGVKKTRANHGTVLWFTGISGSGKTTLASELERRLVDSGMKSPIRVLDGDEIRKGLNSDLGYSNADRSENVRRVGEVAKLFTESGFFTIVALISPFRKDRDSVRNSLPPNRFIEVFLDCPMEVCEKRDPKGLYIKARNKTVKDFTGISSPYESPLNPDILLRTDLLGIDDCAQQVIHYLQRADSLIKLPRVGK